VEILRALQIEKKNRKISGFSLEMCGNIGEFNRNYKAELEPLWLICLRRDA
jgi:hypothetical protein